MAYVGYKAAVKWIADNDESRLADYNDVEEISGMLTVNLVADLWHKNAEDVARDVVTERKKNP